jgi:hypothetical protein
MENLSTHYALMDAQEECVKRPLPLAVVLYHVYLKTVHSGMTMQQVLDLDEVEFGQFLGEAMQITCSAGLFPYEQDFEPGLCLSFFHGITLAAVPTEDMVSPFPPPVIPRPHAFGWFCAGVVALHGPARRQDGP